ncbi:hypothetical protein ES706_01758 [subsurface metagenome]
MTLVLTEISRYGIVMGADSAVTCETQLPTGERVPRVLIGVQKLFSVPYLKAGVSCWGYGQIGDIETDVWLNDFIWRLEGQVGTLQEFARRLRDELRAIIGPGSGQGECGFHLAGFVEEQGPLVPDFWHIHNGPSEYFRDIDATIFNANHDLAVARAQGRYDPSNPNMIYITRNGDYRFYAVWWEAFEKVIDNFLRAQGIQVPKPSLQGRIEYVRFQIRSISEIYKMSTRLPSIGGEISTLAIETSGIHSFDRRA